jgi:hypothetical protein
LSRKTGQLILYAPQASFGVRDKDVAPVDICLDNRLNSFFTFSSNVGCPTVQRFTGNFVPPARSFAFSNLRDIFVAILWIGSNAIGLDEVPLKFIKKISSVNSSC